MINHSYTQAVKDYLNGESMKSISIKIGVPVYAMRRAFKRRGVVFPAPKQNEIIFYDGRKFTFGKIGYFQASGGDKELLHRYMWKKEVGPIPDGYHIHHKDHNKRNNVISNFECLSAGDHMRLHCKNGAISLYSKLTALQVIDIRNICHSVSTLKLSKIYNVSTEQIRRIIRRNHWKHVNHP